MQLTQLTLQQRIGGIIILVAICAFTSAPATLFIASNSFNEIYDQENRTEYAAILGNSIKTFEKNRFLEK